MIILNKNTLRSKKNLIAQVCKSLHELLSEEKPISIEIHPDVSLKDAADAMINIVDILHTAGSVDKKDEIDEADRWKYDDFDDESF